jgi:hypothetical protein
VELRTDRTRNVELHRAANDAAVTAIHAAVTAIDAAIGGATDGGP